MTIRLTSRARKDLRRLSAENRERVRDALLSLGADPLRGVPLAGPWAGYHRVRVGDLRVIYRVRGDEVIVHYVRGRGQVYRGE